MLQTLLVNLKLHFREKAQLFWLFAFPIILATMFNGMFGNIAESYALHTVDVVVVNNDDWRASPGAQMLVDGISSDTGATGADGDHAKVDDDGDAMPKLITVTEAASMEAADRALLDAKAQGRLSVDGSGKLQLAISPSHANIRHGCDGVEQWSGYFPDGVGQYRGLVQSQHRRGDQCRAAQSVRVVG